MTNELHEICLRRIDHLLFQISENLKAIEREVTWRSIDLKKQ